MAWRVRRRKCKHCGRLFLPDARNAAHQRYCSQPECRKASKASSQKRRLQKSENQDYFRSPDNVKRVQLRRKDHPGYWRKPLKSPTALQDYLITKPIEHTKQNGDFAQHALQDLSILQPAVLVGLISQSTGYALQEDIARAARRLQQLGHDILNPQGGPYDRKTSDTGSAYNSTKV